MSTVLGRLDSKLAGLERREIVPVTARFGDRVVIRGQELIDFTSFDYVGLRLRTDIAVRAHQAVESFGVGTCSSRFSAGQTELHSQCEYELGRFFYSEAALLFSSRMQAFWTLICAVVSPSDLVFIDSSCQSAFPEVVELVGGISRYVDLQDLERLEEEFQRASATSEKFLVIDGVSGVFGTSPALLPVLELASKHGIHIILDESFAIGQCGLRGSGIGEDFRLQNALGAGPLCSFFDMAFGMAGFGAAIVGSRSLIELLLLSSRSLREECPLPPVSAAWALAAIPVIEVSAISRERLLDLANGLRAALAGAGFKVPSGQNGCIVSVNVKDKLEAEAFVLGIRSRGILGELFHVEQLLKRSYFVRFVVTARHTSESISKCCEAIDEVTKRLNR